MTDPALYVAFVIGIYIGFGSILVYLACRVLVAGLDNIEARRRARLTIEASDHHEPSRAQVEADMTAALLRTEAERALSDAGTDGFLDALTAGRPHLRAILDANRAAADIDAEWDLVDDLPGWVNEGRRTL